MAASGVQRLYPISDEVKKALGGMDKFCHGRRASGNWCCWSAVAAGDLRGVGLPRLHPLRLPPPGTQVAGDRLQRPVLRHDPHHLPAIARSPACWAWCSGYWPCKPAACAGHALPSACTTRWRSRGPAPADVLERWPLVADPVRSTGERGRSLTLAADAVAAGWPPRSCRGSLARLSMSPEEELQEAIDRGASDPLASARLLTMRAESGCGNRRSAVKP